MAKLLQGDVIGFAEDLKEVVLQIASFHDIAKNPEIFYHGLMLGITAHLYQQGYIIKSNRESGLGRFDIIIIPHNTLNKAIIIELKNVDKPKKLEKEAKRALLQIDKKEYIAEIAAHNVKDIVKIGIAFCGKEFAVKAR